MLLKALLLVLCIQWVSADCNANVQTSVLQCYAPLFQYYGVANPSDKLPAFADVVTAIQARMDQQGQQAAQDFCIHANQLNICLNQTQYPLDLDCYNHLTTNSDDSYSYMEEQATHDYECGLGYKIFISEYYCMKAVDQNQAAQIQQCQDDLNNNLNNGMAVCKAYDMYISCQSVIYAKFCDYNAGVFNCNILRVALDSVYNVCDSQHQLTPCPDYH